jgi:hypothetical protein
MGDEVGPWRSSYLTLFLMIIYAFTSRHAIAQPKNPESSTAMVDIVPDFLSFWAAAQSKDEATQVEMFRKLVMDRHPELFTAEVVSIGQEKGEAEVNRRIARYLKQVQPFIPAIRVLNDRIASDLQTYSADFATVFPDHRPIRQYTSRFPSAISMGARGKSQAAQPCYLDSIKLLHSTARKQNSRSFSITNCSTAIMPV